MSGNDDVMLVSEWEDLTVAQLKEELVGRGLETTGRKADLVARLEANDRGMFFQQCQTFSYSASVCHSLFAHIMKQQKVKRVQISWKVC